MALANTLAYYDTATIMALKCFVVNGSGKHSAYHNIESIEASICFLMQAPIWFSLFMTLSRPIFLHPKQLTSGLYYKHMTVVNGDSSSQILD
jgi:hypothetical protein